MKAWSVSVVSTLFVLGLASGAVAQMGGYSSTPGDQKESQTPRTDAKPDDQRQRIDASPTTAAPEAPKPDAVGANPSATTPPGSPTTSGAAAPAQTGGGTQADVKPQASGDALPRTAVERTTIFGLSPTAAVLIAAALLVVVILAIVAMTRNTDRVINRIDTRPRM